MVLGHGRICMLAAMGYVILEITSKLPRYVSPLDVPNALAAISEAPVAGWAQILAHMAFCEASQGQQLDARVLRTSLASRRSCPQTLQSLQRSCVQSWRISTWHYCYHWHVLP